MTSKNKKSKEGRKEGRKGNPKQTGHIKQKTKTKSYAVNACLNLKRTLIMSSTINKH